MESDKVPERAWSWKDFVPFVGFGFALLYGVGWLVQYQMRTGLGVGPLGVSHESAIATSFAFLVSLLPEILYFGMMVWTMRREEKPLRKRCGFAVLAGTLLFLGAVFVLFCVPLWTGNASSDLRIRAGTMWTGQWIVGTMSLLTYAFAIKGDPEESRRLRPLFAAFLITMALLLAGQLFGTHVLPLLPESFGGLGTSRVRVHLKVPNETFEGTFAASDDKAVVFTNVVHEDGITKPTRVLRIPSDRIVDLSPIR